MFFTQMKLFLLNKILQYNESSVELLKQYSTKTFNLNIVGISIIAQINQHGKLQALPPNTTCDVEVLIPSSLINFLIDKDKIEAFRKISIKKDTEFGQALLEIMANLHLSGLYANSPVIMGVVISELESMINTIKNYLTLLGQNTHNSVGEYLLYETQDLVNKYELQNFCNDVDNLINRVDILNQRVDLLLAI